VTNLLGGHIDAAWANPMSAIGQLEAKQVKILAVCTEKRSSMFPNQPTFREQGYDVISRPDPLHRRPGRESRKEAVDYWIAVLDKVRKTPEWKKFLQTSLLEDAGW